MTILSPSVTAKLKPLSARIPRVKALDSSISLFNEGYNFISNRCRELRTNAFRARIMFRPVVCMQGEEAAKVFYNPELFIRKNSAPVTTLKLLQDIGSVNGSDDNAHQTRKQLFTSFMAKESVMRLMYLAENEFQKSLREWEGKSDIILHDEIQEIFCTAVLQWVGLTPEPYEIRRRTEECAAVLEGSGSIGFANLKAQWLRSRCESWAQETIKQIRYEELDVDSTSPVHILAWHRDFDGKLLSQSTAAVELIKLIQSVVAVARFVVFGALALHEHPHLRKRMESPQFLNLFVQEVRRFYPFFPFVVGRTKKNVHWNGAVLKKGQWVLFDLYGTNHDPEIWDNPHLFNPERFLDWNGGVYGFVPQGGGVANYGHRCPIEAIAVALMEMSMRILSSSMDYDVPEQNLEIKFNQMPALPQSGFKISKVRQRTRAPSHSRRVNAGQPYEMVSSKSSRDLKF